MYMYTEIRGSGGLHHYDISAWSALVLVGRGEKGTKRFSRNDSHEYNNSYSGRGFLLPFVASSWSLKVEEINISLTLSVHTNKLHSILYLTCLKNRALSYFSFLNGQMNSNFISQRITWCLQDTSYSDWLGSTAHEKNTNNLSVPFDIVAWYADSDRSMPELWITPSPRH